MPRSMTGYGKAEYRNDRYEITVELRNLNNRYLDIGLKLPKAISGYEFSVKDLIKQHVQRGKVTVSVYFRYLGENDGVLKINDETVHYYHKLLERIKAHTGIRDEITLDHLLHFKELLEPEEATVEDAGLEKSLLTVLEKALTDLNRMRRAEADNLIRDIFRHLDRIETTLVDIRERGQHSARAELEKLYGRLRELVNGGEVDRGRLEQELALIADRVDITEECTRLKSHIDLFRETCLEDHEVGKKLTFILQEMLRESNTIGSKTTDTAIAHHVIRLKEEIEKIREQAQNLE